MPGSPEIQAWILLFALRLLSARSWPRRGRLLTHFYNLRYSNGGGVPVTEEIRSGGEPVGREAIAGVCRELADVGFIEWTPYRPGHVIGLARIRGPGVHAVDRRGSAVLEIQFPDAPAPATPDMDRKDEGS